MQITNTHNLPKTLVDVVANRMYKPKPNRYSVTTLIGPPLIKTLTTEHWDNLQTDVSDHLWSTLGSAVHNILASGGDVEYELFIALSTFIKQSTIDNDNTPVRRELLSACHNLVGLLSVVPDVSVEHKIEYPLEGSDFTLVGVIDLIEEDKIADYKVTSVWSFLDGLKPEWEAQLNMYAFLREMERRQDNSITPVRHLSVNAILRDWQSGKAMQRDYPNIPFTKVNVPLWSLESQRDFIYSRIDDHECNPKRECTSEEKWQRSDKYALHKVGRKSAVKVEDTLQELKDYCVSKELVTGTVKFMMGEDINVLSDNLKTNYFIDKRQGECVRCDRYCMVSDFCPFKG